MPLKYWGEGTAIGCSYHFYSKAIFLFLLEFKINLKAAK